ncbi:MAG TPA: VWA domain-containing protein [Terriglobales bacterium]|nr:VWA domain-containing protein [Terriglobales bacterium]
MKATRSFVLLMLAGAVICTASGQSSSLDPETLIPTHFLLTAKIKKEFSTDLTAAELQVKENGNRVAIQEIKKLDDPRMRYCILFDTSNSTRASFQLMQRAALAVLQQTLHPDTDSGWLVLFNTGLAQSEETKDTIAIGNAISAARPAGGTAFYDAVTQCAHRMAQGPDEPSRKVMFVFSDGDDNQSKMSSKAAIQAAIEAGVRVYIAYPEPGVPSQPSILKHLTEETGGAVFVLNGNKDSAVFATALDQELRSLLTITYARKPSQENEVRHIDIKCERKGVRISAPKSIYLHN